MLSRFFCHLLLRFEHGQFCVVIVSLNSVEDLYHIIRFLKNDKRLSNSEVYLLGASEGTVIAPLFAEKYPEMIDKLLLWGYLNINFKDNLVWQNSGKNFMILFNEYFDADEYGRISREAYEADPNNMAGNIMIWGFSFDDFDKNGDGYICEEDIKNTLSDYVGYTLEDVLSAIERRDDRWLMYKYGQATIPLTSGWFLQHWSLRSNMEVLPTLELPIYIFHGTLDMHVDVRGVYEINDKFNQLGKTNLTINVFDKHDHILNFDEIIEVGSIPPGIQAILDTVGRIN